MTHDHPTPDEVRRILRITCADAIGLMTDWLEELLTDGDRERLAAHLDGCVACGVYLDQLRSTVTIMGSLRGASDWSVSDEEMGRLLELWREGRQSADQN